MRPTHGRVLARIAWGLLAALAPVAAAAQPLTVSAASSLADVMAEAGRAWVTVGGAGVTVNASGSNVLARQVAAGVLGEAPVAVDVICIDRAGTIVGHAR